MSTEKKSVISTLENVIEDFDSIKTGMEYVGLTVGTEPTSNYGELIKGLKESLDKVAQVETLVEENESLNIQVTEDNGYFNDIYEAIVEQGQTPDIDDRSTYAAAILAIEGGGSSSGSDVEINDMSYFFYNGARSENIDTWLSYAKNVVNWTKTFYGCNIENGKTIDIDGSSISSLDNSYIFSYIKTANSSDEITLKALVKDYGRYAFNYCNYLGKGLVNVILEISEDSTLESLSNCFEYAYGIKDIQFIGDFSKIKYINYMFRGFNSSGNSNSLVELDLSSISFDFSNMLEMKYAFYEAKLTSILFPESTVIGDCNLSYAFADNTKLNSIKLDIIQNVLTNSYVDDLFEGCTTLSEVNSNNNWIIGSRLYCTFNNCQALISIPNIVLYINSSTTKNFYNVFRNCNALRNIDLTLYNENSIKLYMNQSFYNCTALENITGNLDMSCLYSVTNPFYGCTALKTIETTGSIGGNTTVSSLTLDLSASAVFDIAGFISQLASNNSGYTRTIKLNATVYSALSEETIALAATKNYTLASA